MGIEELKLGQETNSEAIQSLQDSILLVTSKFQDFMNKNKTGSHSLSLAKQSCVPDEFANYVNDDCVGVDNSIVIQESTNPLTYNRVITEQQRIDKSKCKEYNDLPKELDGNVDVKPLEKNSNSDTSTNVPMTDQTDAKVYCPTYADIVANFPPSPKPMKILPRTTQMRKRFPLCRSRMVKLVSVRRFYWRAA